jgi:hypothetical protein
MQQSHQQALLAKYPQFRQKIHTLTQYAFGAYQPVEDPFGGMRTFIAGAPVRFLTPCRKFWKIDSKIVDFI